MDIPRPRYNPGDLVVFTDYKNDNIRKVGKVISQLPILSKKNNIIQRSYFLEVGDEVIQVYSIPAGLKLYERRKK